MSCGRAQQKSVGSVIWPVVSSALPLQSQLDVSLGATAWGQSFGTNVIQALPGSQHDPLLTCSGEGEIRTLGGVALIINLRYGNLVLGVVV